MKRVYVIFESRSESWSDMGSWEYDYVARNYENRFVDVYDTYPAAVQSIRDWAESQKGVTYRKSDKFSEKLLLLLDNSPYSNDDKVWLTREIKSTLLKSS